MRRERCAMYMRSLLLFWGLTTLAVGNALAEGPNLGKLIDPADIAAWNIDIEPDGAGLPAGRRPCLSGGANFFPKFWFCSRGGGEGGGFFRAGGPPRPRFGGRTTIVGTDARTGANRHYSAL